MSLDLVQGADLPGLRAFLTEADLTLVGLDAAGVHLWIERDEDGTIIGSTGSDLSSEQ